jgi:hypothetical protein
LLTTKTKIQRESQSGSPSNGFTELSYLRDKFQVFQVFENRAPLFKIGEKPAASPRTYSNPIRTALQYKGLLKSGHIETQAELASFLGVSRAKVTQMLNLLKLDGEIIEMVSGLDEEDERLRRVTERRLRELTQIEDEEEQMERFREMVG